MKNKIIIGVILLVIGGFVYNTFFNTQKPVEDDSTSQTPVANLNYTLVSPHKFDTENYVEGLEFYNGKLYSSSGPESKSFLAVYDIKTGEKSPNVKMSKEIFAEGMTILNNTLYQLTYKNNKVLLYDPATLKPKGELPWKHGEGWGLTNNGKDLIASNGSNIIFFLKPENLEIVKTINVSLNGRVTNQINELEYVNGYIYANQFTTDYIYKINANTGVIESVGDFSKLLPEYNAQATAVKQGEAAENYFNGIAYNKETGNFWVGGKRWPQIFEVKF